LTNAVKFSFNQSVILPLSDSHRQSFLKDLFKRIKYNCLIWRRIFYLTNSNSRELTKIDCFFDRAVADFKSVNTILYEFAHIHLLVYTIQVNQMIESSQFGYF
jgi:hypothetical protein